MNKPYTVPTDELQLALWCALYPHNAAEEIQHMREVIAKKEAEIQHLMDKAATANDNLAGVTVCRYLRAKLLKR